MTTGSQQRQGVLCQSPTQSSSYLFVELLSDSGNICQGTRPTVIASDSGNICQGTRPTVIGQGTRPTVIASTADFSTLLNSGVITAKKWKRQPKAKILSLSPGTLELWHQLEPLFQCTYTPKHLSDMQHTCAGPAF